jgi:putative ABC transport system permease protein
MSLKYVLSSLRRRKLRTLIIALALTIGVALVGALLALVDTQRQFSIQTIGAETGGYDLSITKSDLAASTFFDTGTVSTAARAAYSQIAQALPRIQSSIEARRVGASTGDAVTLIAIDADNDALVSLAQAASSSASTGLSVAGIRIGTTGGQGGGPGGGGFPGGGPPDGGPGGAPGNFNNTTAASRVRSVASQAGGVYPPTAGQVFLDSTTAGTLGAQTGDEIELSYAIPAQRLAGEAAVTGVSAPRLTARFVVAGVGSLSGLGSSVSNGLVMRLEDAQAWLGKTGQANRMLLVWQSKGSGTTNAKATVTEARAVGETVRDDLQKSLGSEFTVSLPKYSQLETASSAFTFTQTYITLYGVLSMSIIGLMVNALMTTTVAEQKYDLAVLRVLGAPRARLYEVVIIEVAALGLIGIVLGLLLGRVINDNLIVPIVLANLQLPAGVRADWTLSTVLIPTAITIGVLALATISPAQKAANTKVMVVLNPSAADQPTLEDLTALRERRADGGLLIAGLVMLGFSGVILIALPTVFTRGNVTGQTVLNSGSLLLMVVGIALLFYFLTTPLERVLIALYGLIAPKAAFFAGRYSLRSKGRNALISLMVVMSGVLPCLLATQLALQDANVETDSRFNNGAPVVAQVRAAGGGGDFFQVFRRVERADAILTSVDFATIRNQSGIATVVGVADNLNGIQVSDRIGLRSARVNLVGVSDDLNKVLYTDLLRWTEGDATALTRLATDRNAAIIGDSLSTALDLRVGDTLLVKGTGNDHELKLTIVAVGARIPGFSRYFSRTSSEANGSGVLVNLETYRDLQNDPALGSIDLTKDLMNKVFATTQPGVNNTTLLRSLRNTLSTQNGMTLVATSEQITTARATLEQSRVFIVLLTLLSMVTAIFGVLAVMYTAVMGRRVEIGMLKAIGAARAELRGIFIGEAVVTTLAAGLAGIIAGTLLGYAFVLSQRLQSDLPFKFAFDFNTAGIIIAMVVVAAVVGGTLATQPVIRQKAITILRER